MKAAGFDEFGPAEVLHTIEVEPAEPGPGEVRIANKAAGVQRFDTMIRAGRGPAEKMITSFPAIPGNEFAGVVDAIGPDVENVAIGDEVIGWRLLGSYSETLIAPADQLVPKPPAMSWEIAG
ncbi:MAG: quinone oxidoreductase family protein, partial [Thermomicrobiales bacterium]